ncbi:MAG: GNAT family N-acetyltransferase [Longimicrobiales bacterium]
MSVQLPTIRLAAPQDAAAIHDIYAPIVRDTAISFEWEVPTLAEVRSRIDRVLADGFPWLVAEVAGQVGGYAYASAFRSRIAYSWTAEVSVYVHSEHHRRGIGRSVYGSLLRLLELQGYRSAYGIATTPNPGSERLHRTLGFQQVGHFPRVGYKFGAWHDVICWHITLGPQDLAPEPIRPVSEVLRNIGPAGVIGRSW